MKTFPVKTYYRLNTELANVIAKEGYSFTIVKGHRFQVACNATDEAMIFAKANPDCLIMDLTYDELMGTDKGLYKGKTRYVIIGVSLKMTTLDEFKILTRKPIFCSFELMSVLREDEKYQTENKDIFIYNGNYVFHAENEVVPLTEVEEQWVSLWEGFDHYYSYTDDSSVYRRWKDREDKIYSEGGKLGLTTTKMKAIYKKVFCKN